MFKVVTGQGQIKNSFLVPYGTWFIYTTLCLVMVVNCAKSYGNQAMGVEVMLRK